MLRPSRWEKCLVRQTLISLSTSVFICDDPNISFIENCGILRLDPNHFIQLSEIFQLLKAQLG